MKLGATLIRLVRVKFSLKRENRREELKIVGTYALIGCIWIYLSDSFVSLILSTISEDGHPYGVPLSYAYKNNAIYFHCAVEGQKLYNIANNSKVSFCLVGSTNSFTG